MVKEKLVEKVFPFLYSRVFLQMRVLCKFGRLKDEAVEFICEICERTDDWMAFALSYYAAMLNEHSSVSSPSGQMDGMNFQGLFKWQGDTQVFYKFRILFCEKFFLTPRLCLCFSSCTSGCSIPNHLPADGPAWKLKPRAKLHFFIRASCVDLYWTPTNGILKQLMIERND